MIAAIANRPVCSQNWLSWYGASRSRAHITTRASLGPWRRAVSDTRQLPGAEQPGRTEEQHDDHHHVGRDVAEPAAQEGDVVLVAADHRDRDADDQPADHRAEHG